MATSRAREILSRTHGKPQVADRSTGSDAELVMRSELYGSQQVDGPSVVAVPGYVEAVESCTWNDEHGFPLFARARDHGRMGTIASADHPGVQANPQFWQALKIAVDLPWPPAPPPSYVGNVPPDEPPDPPSPPYLSRG